MSSNRGLYNNKKMFYIKDKRVVPNAPPKRARKNKTSMKKDDIAFSIDFKLSGVAAILLLYYYAPALDNGIKGAISLLIIFSSLHIYKKED